MFNNLISLHHFEMQNKQMAVFILPGFFCSRLQYHRSTPLKRAVGRLLLHTIMRGDTREPRNIIEANSWYTIRDPAAIKVSTRNLPRHELSSVC